MKSAFLTLEFNCFSTPRTGVAISGVYIKALSTNIPDRITAVPHTANLNVYIYACRELIMDSRLWVEQIRIIAQ